jgi:hypothetical protein
MAARRDRPADHRIGDSLLRLPDGATISVPLGEGRAAQPCCFCGGTVAADAADHVAVSARFLHAGEERTQGWSAHRGCLAARMHESVSGIGPLFIAG